MSDDKISLRLSPELQEVRREAEAMGIGLTKLLTADLARYRRLAEAAVPPLDEWQWGLLSHVLDGIERLGFHAGRDELPSPAGVAAMIEEWADGASLDADILRAGELGRAVLAWPPLAVAGVMLRLRAESARPIGPPASIPSSRARRWTRGSESGGRNAAARGSAPTKPRLPGAPRKRPMAPRNNSRWLSIEVHFLDGRFHGLTAFGRPEWPPSPARLFQALVTAARTGARRHKPIWSGAKTDALREFARLDPPVVHAGEPLPGLPYSTSEPLNNLDHLAAAWARGKEPKLDRNELNVLLAWRPQLLLEPSVRYLWRLEPRQEPWAALIAEEARHVTMLGRGEDLVAANGLIAAEPAHPGGAQLVWIPAPGTSTAVPARGLLDEIFRRQRQRSRGPLRQLRYVDYEPAPAAGP